MAPTDSSVSCLHISLLIEQRYDVPGAVPRLYTLQKRHVGESR
jgi:hypothetical protein